MDVKKPDSEETEVEYRNLQSAMALQNFMQELLTTERIKHVQVNTVEMKVGMRP
jgi:hypothetical protein